jgi:uncharacterized protein YdaL
MANVGYKRPPTATRYVKGQSGNPKGRPKGSKNLRAVLAEELSQRVTVNNHGKKKRLSVQSVMLKQVLQKAAAGDLKAASMVLRIIQQVDPDHATAPQNQPISERDDKILADFLQRKGISL